MSIRTFLVALLLLATIGTGALQAQPNRAGANNRAQNQADADAAAAAVGGVMCFAIGIGVIAIVVKVLIILFIVSDARKRGMDPTMYVILEIFTGLIGLIIYLCSREPLLTERKRYARDYDGDEHDDDQPKRSRRYRGRNDDDDRDRRRDDDY
jgi:hypothetical protein